MGFIKLFLEYGDPSKAEILLISGIPFMTACCKK